MEESQEHIEGGTVNTDMFKGFQQFDSGTVKNLPTSISLDSIEKTLYVKLYGKKGEKKVSKRKPVKVEKKSNIEPLINNFFKGSSHYVPINMPELYKIAEYLSEFQDKKLTKVKDLKPDVGQKDIKGISWKNQQKAELFSLHAKRKHMDRVAAIEVTRNLHCNVGYEEKIVTEKMKPDTGFGLCKRFVGVPTSITPGPGSYGNDLNLHIPQKPTTKPTSIVPTFEWPAQSRDTNIYEGLAPNTYQFTIHNSIKEKVERKLTQRGPYDTFTGPRDLSTIKNHFAPPNLISNQPWWPLNFPGMFDKLHDHGKKFYGRWGSSKRTMLRTNYPDTPAPNRYQNVKLKDFKQNKYAFNSSVQWIWDGPQKTLPTPGPGRYFSRPTKPIRKLKTTAKEK